VRIGTEGVVVILVVGGSGLLGHEVALQLLRSGEHVRVLTRTPVKALDLENAGAEVVRGDLVDATSLRRACLGADGVFDAAHSMLGKGRYRSEAVDDAGNRSLIDAAVSARVSRFVLVSILGADGDHPVDFWRTKFRIEHHLRDSGLSYTILRPAAFMETHVHALNGKAILRHGKTVLLGKGTKPRNFVAVADVARFAVMALTSDALSDRTLEVGGPDNLCDSEVVGLYSREAGLSPKVWRLPRLAARGASVLLKPIHPGVSRVMYIGSLPDSAFEERFDPSPLLAEFPMDMTTVENFIGDRVSEAGMSAVSGPSSAAAASLKGHRGVTK
jgi:uncharacterized protein YbjT (DUF2867 family)